jgi:CRISPR-associated protein Cas2
MKQFIVVAYDIADDRRRQKIAKLLVQYGLRCNESVFECLLTEAKISKLQQQLLKLADEQEDIILYYYLCKPCVLKRESIGRRPKIQPEIVMV